MEQSCYKCGQVMEEGRPFCPHCSAPQIRVVVAEPVPAAAASFADRTDSSPREVALPASKTVPILALPMKWSQLLKPCALAALVASALMVLGLHPLVAMFCVGFLAVAFYRQGRPGMAIRAVVGARLGAISGLLWFTASAILELIVVVVMHKGPEIRKVVLQQFEQAASRTNDPQVLALFEKVKTPEGFELAMLLIVAFGFVAAIALGASGGALGALILGRRNKSE